MLVYQTVKVWVGFHSHRECTRSSVAYEECFTDCSIARVIHHMLSRHPEQCSISYQNCLGIFVSLSPNALLEQSATCTDDRFGEDEVMIGWNDDRGHVLHCFGGWDSCAMRSGPVISSMQNTPHEFSSVDITTNIKCELGRRKFHGRFGLQVQLFQISMFRALRYFCWQAGAGFELEDYDVFYMNAQGEYVRLPSVSFANYQHYSYGDNAVRLRIVPAVQAAPLDFDQLLLNIIGDEPGTARVPEPHVPEPRVPHVMVVYDAARAEAVRAAQLVMPRVPKPCVPRNLARYD